MKPAEESPFFYRCHLKASRKSPDANSADAEQRRSGQSSYSGEREPDDDSRRNDSLDYSDRDATGSLDAD